MLHRPLHEIELADLQGLCDRKVIEDTRLDYIEDLPGREGNGPVSFLSDVTAMANTAGGDLIYGIREERAEGKPSGVPAQVVGMERSNFDERRLWFENLLRDCTDPRVTGIGFQPVEVDGSRIALVVRVPPSWNGPHVVKHGGHWKFYARHSAGNYPMDVNQLREAFAAGATLAQKLESFRSARLEHIRHQLGFGRSIALLVTHLLPFEAVRPGNLIDLERAGSNPDNLMLGRWQNRFAKVRLNFDGIFSSEDGTALKGYVQVFRSGITEEVDTFSLNHHTDDDGVKCLHAPEFESSLIRGVGRRLSLLKGVGVSSPVLICLSFLGVAGFRLSVRYDATLSPMKFEHKVDRGDLLLPGLLVENVQELKLEGKFAPRGESDHYSWLTASRLLPPLFNMVWNAAGVNRSLYYDDENNWTGRY